jgi:hypothetical protein
VLDSIIEQVSATSNVAETQVGATGPSKRPPQKSEGSQRKIHRSSPSEDAVYVFGTEDDYKQIESERRKEREEEWAQDQERERQRKRQEQELEREKEKRERDEKERRDREERQNIARSLSMPQPPPPPPPFFTFATLQNVTVPEGVKPDMFYGMLHAQSMGLMQVEKTTKEAEAAKWNFLNGKN